ncbi:MAG: hypothetical protein WC441_04780 [Patescibacteria group bacterium]
MSDMKEQDIFGKGIFKTWLEISPKIDLDEFLATFTGFYFQGRKGFLKSQEYLREKRGDCIVTFHSWWVVLKNGADWMNCLKFSRHMNDWKGDENTYLGEFINGKRKSE